jgi:hypothetical protein
MIDGMVVNRALAPSSPFPIQNEDSASGLFTGRGRRGGMAGTNSSTATHDGGGRVLWSCGRIPHLGTYPNTVATRSFDQPHGGVLAILRLDSGVGSFPVQLVYSLVAGERQPRYRRPPAARLRLQHILALPPRHSALSIILECRLRLVGSEHPATGRRSGMTSPLNDCLCWLNGACQVRRMRSDLPSTHCCQLIVGRQRAAGVLNHGLACR